MRYFLIKKLMYKIAFFDDAKADYLEIWKYIAQDNLYYANEVLNKIDSSINTIANFPFIWKEMKNWLRLIVEPTYKFKIIYDIKKDFIYIISIFKYKNMWE